ncbi:hypothetical protein GCM10010446_26380 [Streptomyces enissocaesilis]|uniref:Uncharacterized protein n=1 Tax=Streptomyces enissocaesilis TaxID=332589 RepID=A0ABN3X759_9ACTN
MVAGRHATEDIAVTAHDTGSCASLLADAEGPVVAQVGSATVPALLAAARDRGRSLWLVPRDETSATLDALVARTQAATVIGEKAPEHRITGRALVAGRYLYAQSDHSAPVPRQETDEPGVGLVTSGSTGEPRGVWRSWSALLLEARTVAAELRVGEHGSSVICAAPLSHAYGLVLGLLAAEVTEARPVLLEQTMTGTRMLQLAERYRAGVLVAVPAQYARMRRRSATVVAPELLAVCVSAGSTLTPQVRDSFAVSFGRAITNHYGTTASGSIAVSPGAATQGCIGSPYRGVDIARDDDGQLLVRTPWSADPARAEPTGDIGSWDGQSWHVSGRTTDQININGRKTTRARIEAVIATSPQVTDVAVEVLVSSAQVPLIVAFVAAGNDEAVSGAAEVCRAQLPPFARPKRFVRVASIPRSERGKLLRHRLPPLPDSLQGAAPS